MYTISIILGIAIRLTAGFTVETFGPIFPEAAALHWDDSTQDLYFVDALVSQVNRYDWQTKQFYAAPIDGNIIPVFILPIYNQPGKFLTSSLDLSAGVVAWDGQNSIATGYDPLFFVQNVTEHPVNGWNLAKASPTGTFFGSTAAIAGLCGPTQGPDAVLARYNNGHVKILDRSKMLAGMAWHPIESAFYYINSCENIINKCTWNVLTNDISFCRPVFHFNDPNPQVGLIGLTIDTDGFLYATAFNGGYVIKVNPKTQRQVLRIEVGPEALSDIAFAGPNLDTLVVSSTTVAFNLTDGGVADPPKNPLSGHLFRIDGLNAKGFPHSKWSPRDSLLAYLELRTKIIAQLFN